MIETVIKIGVTFTGTDEKHNNYVSWLQTNDLVEITRLSVFDSNLYKINNLDGIILSGGLDIHPRFYNSDITNYENCPLGFDERRDEFEIAVYEMSQKKGIPVLCICRGMQLVNCILGGTLTQDIGPVANAIHQFEHHDKAHALKIVPGTFLHEIAAIESTVVNSAHHQAIEKLGNGLAINCTSGDGIIEGIEWDDRQNKPFFLGVQWHPERMFKFNLEETATSKNIRDRFINEVKNSIKNLL